MRGFDRQQTILVASVLLLAAGFGVFRYMPLLRQRQAMDATMEQNQKTLQDIHTQGMRLPELSQELARVEAKAAAFDARIPAGRSFAEMWRQIADLMNQYDLTDQVVQPGQPTEADQIGAIPLTLSCSGTTEDMYSFFRAIEQWDRLIRFEQVEMSNDGDFSGIVKLSAKAQFYYQPEQKQG